MDEKAKARVAKWRLRLLVVVLVALIAHAWITDRRTPASPGGTFGEAVDGVVLLLLVVGGVTFFWTWLGELFRWLKK